ncbi:MAG: 50S ribosomal protein L24 [Helicobacteraceae bacterium]|jgi:large subunit ribosomal protein L24|nr:50S ribosomal protein L24 [Helicobacteraceae bacterium]
MPKFSIKKGDKVLVIAGDDRGKEGKVLRVFPKDSLVIVEGAKVVKKAVKPSEKNKEGGFIAKEKPIHISNVKKVEG